MDIQSLIEDLNYVLSALERGDTVNALRVLSLIIMDIRAVERRGETIRQWQK